MRPLVPVRLHVLALAVAAVVATPGCEKLMPSDANVQIAVDAAALARLEARVEKVMSTPEAGRAMDALFEAVAADPALGKLAGDFGDQLIADPEIARAAEAMLAAIGESPPLMAYAMRHMERNPGATPDQVDEAVGAEVEKRFEVMLQGPIEREIGALIDRADGGAGMAALEKHLSGQFGRVLDGYFEAPERKARWSKRLIELNGGVRPAPGKAAELYIDHAWSEERMLRFLVKACADPEVRRALVAALRQILAAPALRAHLTRATRTLASDTSLRDAVIDVFGLLLSDTTTPAQVDTRVKEMFAAPAVLTAIEDLGQHLLREPALHAVIDDAIRAAAREPSVRAALDELCDGW